MEKVDDVPCPCKDCDCGCNTYEAQECSLLNKWYAGVKTKMTIDEAVGWIDSMINACVEGNNYNDPHRGDKLQALNMAKVRLMDTRDRVVTLEEWISSFDVGDCGALTQMEQLEIKSLLLELKYYRDKAGVGNG